MSKFSQFAGGLAGVVFGFTPVIAADLDRGTIDFCSVSEPNGKLEISGGAYRDNNGANDGGRFVGAGSLALPLGCKVGLQLDGAIGTLDGETMGGIAAHTFTRDPDSYLLGGYGEYAAVGSNNIWRIGAEAELYFDRVTLSAVGGYESSGRTGDDLFASVNLSFYATENFRLTGGYRRFLDIDAGAVGAEWMISDSSLSVFGEGQFGTNNHRKVFAGLRYHFGGGNKSLIRRHREDDPFIHVTNLLRRVPVTSTPTGGGTTGGGETGGGET